MKEGIINKVFLEVEVFAYFLEDDIVMKRPIAFLLVETDDPDTKIIPIAANPQGTWTSMETRITMKDQRELQSSTSTAKREVEE